MSQPSYRLVARARAAAHCAVAAAAVLTGFGGVAAGVALAALLPSWPWAKLSLFARPEPPDPRLALPVGDEASGPLLKVDRPPATAWGPRLTGHAAGAAGLALTTAAVTGLVLQDPYSFHRFLDDVLQAGHGVDLGLWYFYVAPWSRRFDLRLPFFIYQLVVPCTAAACFEAVLAVRMALWERPAD